VTVRRIRAVANSQVHPIRPLHAPSESPTEDLSFDALFRSYAGYVAAISLRILGHGDDVEDVVQDVFVDAMRGIHTLVDPTGVKRWLATITVHVASRRLRRRRFLRAFGVDRSPVEVVAPGASPDERALLAEIFQVLDTLRTNDRVAWSLRYLEGERLEEVAVICRCSLATAKRRIAVAQTAIEEAVGHV
jgi:RNA polymerase sigma-70 factor, ECF subfamily